MVCHESCYSLGSSGHMHIDRRCSYCRADSVITQCSPKGLAGSDLLCVVLLLVQQILQRELGGIKLRLCLCCGALHLHSNEWSCMTAANICAHSDHGLITCEAGELI